MKSKNRPKQTIAQFYDNAYTEIFSNSKIIRSLLQDFVKEPWVEKLDFRTIRVKNSTYKGIRKNKREADLLIKIRLKGGKEIFLFLLIEFQRSPEKFMSLRLLEYLVRVYQDLRKERKRKKLPIVIPFVIYNGKKKWNGPVKFSELLEIPPLELKKYIPDFEYFLINIGSLDDQLLKKLHSVVAYFFLLEKDDPRKFETQEKIIDILRKISHDTELFDLISRYVTAQLEHLGAPAEKVINYIEGKEEKGMLAATIIELVEAREKSERKERNAERKIRSAKKEGERKGKREGVLNLTSDLLRLKFQKKAEDWISQLPQYPLASLEKIGKRILLENSPEKVFKGLKKIKGAQ